MAYGRAFLENVLLGINRRKLMGGENNLNDNSNKHLKQQSPILRALFLMLHSCFPSVHQSGTTLSSRSQKASSKDDLKSTGSNKEAKEGKEAKGPGVGLSSSTTAISGAGLPGKLSTGVFKTGPHLALKKKS